MAANDNSKQSTAPEITRIADAIDNAANAINSQRDRADRLRLASELASRIERAELLPPCRSKDANALLKKAVARARVAMANVA